MSKLSVYIAVLLSLVSVVAVGEPNATPRENWDSYQEVSLQEWLKSDTQLVSEKEGKIKPITLVFYRIGAPVKTLPINIFVDGRYHASLLEDAYTSIKTCPGTHNLFVSQEERTVNTRRKQLPKNNYAMPLPGQVYYYKMKNDANSFAAVDAELGAKEVASVPRLQRHTISRVQQFICD